MNKKISALQFYFSYRIDQHGRLFTGIGPDELHAPAGRWQAAARRETNFVLSKIRGGDKRVPIRFNLIKAGITIGKRLSLIQRQFLAGIVDLYAPTSRTLTAGGLLLGAAQRCGNRV